MHDARAQRVVRVPPCPRCRALGQTTRLRLDPIQTNGRLYYEPACWDHGPYHGTVELLPATHPPAPERGWLENLLRRVVGRSARRALLFLALTDEPLTVDELAFALYGESVDDAARNRTYQVIKRLRGMGVPVEADPGGIYARGFSLCWLPADKRAAAKALDQAAHEVAALASWPGGGA